MKKTCYVILSAPRSVMFCLQNFKIKYKLTFIDVNAIIISYGNKLKHF